MFLAFAKTLEHLAQTLDPVAIGVTQPVLHHATQRTGGVTVIHQIVG
jgi:hypothetical protein